MNRPPYIVGPGYDWAFFLLPPVASLAIGIAISGTVFTDTALTVLGQDVTAAGLLLGTVVHAHLIAVFVRSHGNSVIRRGHPIRFLLVPGLLLVAILSSRWVAITAMVVATFWDVYHSGAQTFGLARIYDRNRGNPPEVSRRLDFWLNQFLYAGPILGGVTLVDHLQCLEDYEHVGATFLRAIPVWAAGARGILAWGVLAAGSVFLLVYVIACLRLRRSGYRSSPHKLFLLTTTGACSIYTWAFNSFGEAFFIMNLFHAVQYLALVWAAEHRQLMRRLRTGSKTATCAAYLGAVLAYGVVAQTISADLYFVWAVTIVVSLMHFWYDGFVWSVAKREV